MKDQEIKMTLGELIKDFERNFDLSKEIILRKTDYGIKGYRILIINFQDNQQ